MTEIKEILPDSKVTLPYIYWRDLVPLSFAEKTWEATLPYPWLLASLWSYHAGYILLGLFCSFYFFLTGLRQSHGAQHYSLGLPKRTQDWMLFTLSFLMLGSMHAVQVSHLHHHRHCLDDEDTEGSTARLPWWQAIAIGPLFITRLHQSAWRLATPAKRYWIAAEALAVTSVVVAALTRPEFVTLQWHAWAMIVGECLTGFFAVWTVHHGCEPKGLFARTQRGQWLNRLCYSMFYHAEHHLYPQIPTCHLARLAARLDQAAPHVSWPQVFGGSGGRRGPDEGVARAKRSAGSNRALCGSHAPSLPGKED
jgi:fatty acid desaturase